MKTLLKDPPAFEEDERQQQQQRHGLGQAVVDAYRARSRNMMPVQIPPFNDPGAPSDPLGGMGRVSPANAQSMSMGDMGMGMGSVGEASDRQRQRFSQHQRSIL
ncbi:hypothetical protein KIPB_009049, partial [Kipferlia bialata]|eukprot:g9049.t1